MKLNLRIYAIILCAIATVSIVACKKDSSNQPPANTTVKAKSLEVGEQSKIFTEDFNGKLQGEIYVTLIPQIGANSNEIILKPVTEPSSFNANMKFIVKNDDGTMADPSIYFVANSKISFSKIGIYRVSGYVPAGNNNMGSDTTKELRIQVASNIPDESFRKYVKNKPFVSFVGEIMDTLSAMSVNIPTNWWLYGQGEPLFKSVEGLNYFKTLKNIDGNTSNNVKVLNISKLSELEYFTWTLGPIENLDLRANKKLSNVVIYECPSLSNLQIANLNNLSFLSCYQTSLISLDLTGLSGLETLRCVSNQITSFDVTQTPKLTELACSKTLASNWNITSLHNLISLSIANTPTTHIEFDSTSNSNPSLSYLFVSHSFKCNENLKQLKRYRGSSMTITLSSDGQADINNYDPIVSCP